MRDCFGLLPSGVGFLITLNLQDGLELIYVAVHLALPNGEFLQWWMTVYLTGFLSPAIIFICPPHIEFTKFYELFCRFPGFCSVLTVDVKDLQEGK